MTDITDYQIEALLLQQAMRLDEIFQGYMASANPNYSSGFKHLNVALRAQAQCRATAVSFQQWKTKPANNPLPPVKP